MSEIKNLDSLADEIYQEGIAKAQAESESIIAKAKEEARKIREEAQIEADEQKRKAETETLRLQSSVENEMKVKSRQAISDLRTQIESMLLSTTLDQEVGDAFDDQKFIQELILKATSHWAEKAELELDLPDEMQQKIHDFLQQKLKDRLANLTIKPVKELKKGFVVEDRKEGYFISFTDEDFQHFLAPYFSRQLEKILFEQDQ
jgi:V/A-type H+-transporting ATPase subunit E